MNIRSEYNSLTTESKLLLERFVKTLPKKDQVKVGDKIHFTGASIKEYNYVEAFIAPNIPLQKRALTKMVMELLHSLAPEQVEGVVLKIHDTIDGVRQVRIGLTHPILGKTSFVVEETDLEVLNA